MCQRCPAFVLARGEQPFNGNLNIVESNLGLPANETGEQARRYAFVILVDYQETGGVGRGSGTDRYNQMGRCNRIADIQLDAVKPVTAAVALSRHCDALRSP